MTPYTFYRLILLLTICLCLSGCGKKSSSEAIKKQSAPPNAPVLTLEFTYGSEKENWLEEATRQFNQSRTRLPSGQVVEVKTYPMGSGELIDEILSGSRQPHIISPASIAFIKLGNAESLAKTGSPVVSQTDNLVLSPVVIAMWKPMAEAIGWGKKPVGWADILAMATSQKGWAAHGFPQWGSFRFGHTHPEFSNSGLISLIAEAYAATGKTAGLTEQDAVAPETAKYIAAIERSVVHYGSSTGFFGKKMFANGPASLSAAVLYENMVIESYSKQHGYPPVVAIYPKEGSFWSDHPAGIVERPWVTAEHRQAGRIYLDYLLSKPVQQQAIPHGFRPADPAVPLAAPLDLAHGVNPQEPKTTLEAPSATVMNSLIQTWKSNKKTSNITLVFDTSGSMREENRMPNAIEGAQLLLSSLDNADRFCLLTFNNQVSWTSKGALLKESREKMQTTISGLFPSGGTALYDAIAAAYDKQGAEASAQGDKISAIVVLTDGANTDGQLRDISQLLPKITADNERQSTRIFTIGYGSGANGSVLKQIAEATQARHYEGTPQNIRQVFRDIATFF